MKAQAYIYKPKLYYEGEDTYVQVPRLLFDAPYDNLTDDARVLYGLLLDQVEVSYDNPDRWIDNGRAYVTYKREALMEMFGVKQEKATKTFRELEERGFIERKRQEFGKPAKIYLNDYWSNPENIPEGMSICDNPSFNGPKRRLANYINVYWALFEEPYKGLSNSARILYGLLRKKIDKKRQYGELSKDAEGGYIYYRVETVMQTLHVAEKKAVKTFRELEQANLITRQRQGLGKPAKIRIHNPVAVEITETTETGEDYPKAEKDKSEDTGRKRTRHRAEKDKTEGGKGQDHLLYNPHTISTLYQSISTEAAATTKTATKSVGRLPREEVEKQVAAQIDTEKLYKSYPRYKSYTDSMTAIMADELASDSPTAKIGGGNCPRAEVRARLSAVTTADVAAILDKMKKNPPKMSNPRGYLLTCLYNAPATRISGKPKKGSAARKYAQELKEEEENDELWKYAEDLHERRAKKGKGSKYVQAFMKEMEAQETKV